MQNPTLGRLATSHREKAVRIGTIRLGLDSVLCNRLNARLRDTLCLLFFWLWLPARAFFINYSAGFRNHHSNG